MRFTKAFFAVALSMLVLDLLWLGVVAKPIYDEALGPLLAKDTVVVAAALFYLQYVVVVTCFAVLPSSDWRRAGLRGAGVGWLAYATYEFTNWALIEGWPSSIVALDIAWGVFLTATVSMVGKVAVGAKQ
jgi:uncharacterized membrane protein